MQTTNDFNIHASDANLLFYLKTQPQQQTPLNQISKLVNQYLCKQSSKTGTSNTHCTWCVAGLVGLEALLWGQEHLLALGGRRARVPHTLDERTRQVQGLNHIQEMSH